MLSDHQVNITIGRGRNGTPRGGCLKTERKGTWSKNILKKTEKYPVSHTNLCRVANLEKSESRIAGGIKEGKESH